MSPTPCAGAPPGFWEMVAPWVRLVDVTEVMSALESSLASMDGDLVASMSTFIEDCSALLAEHARANLRGSAWEGGEALQDLMAWVILQGRSACEQAVAGALVGWSDDVSTRHSRMEIGFLVREALANATEADSDSMGVPDDGEEYVVVDGHHGNHWIFEGADPLVLGQRALLTTWGADEGGVFEVPMSVATEICEESTLDALEEHGLIERHGGFVRLLDGAVPGLGPLWTYGSSTARES